MTQTDLEKKVSDVEISNTKTSESLKSLHKRLDRLEGTIKSINDIALSVRDIAGEVKAMRGDLNDLGGRVRFIEMQPVKKWNNAVDVIVSVSIGAILGYIFPKMFWGNKIRHVFHALFLYSYIRLFFSRYFKNASIPITISS